MFLVLFNVRMGLELTLPKIEIYGAFERGFVL